MLEQRIQKACGRQKADLVLKNGSIINVFTEEIEKADVAMSDGMIIGIGEYEGIEEIDCSGKFIAPGFIDGHIHLESSMMHPVEFTKTVLPRGTTTVITDPHEIANVSGSKGIEYMLMETKGLPLDIYFVLPSCVPSSKFDESGAILKAKDLKPFYENERVFGLGEVMNYVGTIDGNHEVLDKIEDAQNQGGIVDGHAPSLTGNKLCAYITAGVQSDHECSRFEEAKERIRRGQWVMIREGTAAKNLEELISLFYAPFHQRSMLVTDDKHPSDLIKNGHIDYIIKKAVSLGAEPCIAIKMATLNPATYFGMKNKGAVAPNYVADLLILSDLNTIEVESVYKGGILVAKEGKVEKLEQTIHKEENKEVYKEINKKVMNSFHLEELREEDFYIHVKEENEKKKIRMIGLQPKEIITDEVIEEYLPDNNGINMEKDIIKLAVIERHFGTGHKGMAYLKGYGLKKGAIASSVAHDSHNLIVAGTNQSDMCIAANCVSKMQGGIAVVCDGEILGKLPLPIAGLMSELDVDTLEKKISDLKDIARNLGVYEEIDPFMTLAFVSLPVIPRLKLTTFGLVDVIKQQIVDTIINK